MEKTVYDGKVSSLNSIVEKAYIKNRQTFKGGYVMHVRTMEGLVGARMNVDAMDVPMRVFREARRRGDTAVMERALGYAGDFAEKAQEYTKIADEGMKEDAKEAREKAKAEQEKAIEKRKMERIESEKNLKAKTEEKSEEKTEENKNYYNENYYNKNNDSDILEISPEGKALLEESRSAKTGEVSQNH